MMMEMAEWPHAEPRPSMQEIEYDTRVLLGIGFDVSLGRTKNDQGNYRVKVNTQITLARIIISRICRYYRGMSYPEVGNYFDMASHSSIITALSQPISGSDAVTMMCNEVIRRILNDRKNDNVETQNDAK